MGTNWGLGCTKGPKNMVLGPSEAVWGHFGPFWATPRQLTALEHLAALVADELELRLSVIRHAAGRPDPA